MTAPWLTSALLALVLLAACAEEPRPVPPGLVRIERGTYVVGSNDSERQRGYELSPPAILQAGWYDAWEADARQVRLAPFAIEATPVTQAEYLEFVLATGHPVPHISERAYAEQGFLVHPYDEVRRFLWRDGRPPPRLENHPVVLVDLEDARAYCAWRGARDGYPLRLPSEEEWEAACRGQEHRTFPWGRRWKPGAAQMDDSVTAAVRSHPSGATPEGVYDLVGNVFEWTGSLMPDGRPALKGCSWDDAPGTCRCAFRHGRPAASRHILIGFRCAGSP